MNENRVSLIFYFDGKCTDIYPLSKIATGWPVVKKFWPLILLGAMLGYPVGEVVRWYFSVEQLSEIAKEKEGILSLDLFIKESRIKSMLQEAKTRTVELPQLKKEVKQLRAELYDTKYSAGEQKKSYKTMQRKAESLEKELSKARANIRRLKIKRAPANPIDEEP